ARSHAQQLTDLIAQTLDFSTICEDPGAWPDIFSEIPALEESKPPLSPSTALYLRGIAPFLETSSYPSTGELHELPNELGTKYPGYKALRLRGFIHVLPSPMLEDDSGTYGIKPELPIPGFSRIMFMLYKPATRYLVQVLEHAMGDFGSPWTMSVGQQLASQQVVVNVPAASGTGEQNENNDNGTGENTMATTNVTMQAIVDGAALAHDPVQAEKILR
ncbi:MAG: hypothetical protein M1823_007648, partial [Watsoniomyces obsoletus]